MLYFFKDNFKMHLLIEVWGSKNKDDVFQDFAEFLVYKSPVPGILHARTLEWVAISFSNAWKWKWSGSVLSDS